MKKDEIDTIILIRRWPCATKSSGVRSIFCFFFTIFIDFVACFLFLGFFSEMHFLPSPGRRSKTRPGGARPSTGVAPMCALAPSSVFQRLWRCYMFRCVNFRRPFPSHTSSDRWFQQVTVIPRELRGNLWVIPSKGSEARIRRHHGDCDADDD